MHHTKRTAKKRTVREDGGKPKDRRLQLEAMEKRLVEKPRKRLHQFWPGTRASLEIMLFQKSTQLLIQKRPFYRVVKELLQAKKPWFKIQGTAILAIHGAAEPYLVQLLEDSNICAIHTRRFTILPKDIQLNWSNK